MLDIRAYETLTVLGSGQFGSVVLVRRASDRKLFAAKVPHGEDAGARQAARKEAELLMHLHHVNIVQFIELVEDESQLALVMEYASGGDLDAFLQWQQESTGLLSEPAIMRIFIQLVLALQHLHDHHILHRDLKPKVTAGFDVWLETMAHQAPQLILFDSLRQNILLDGDGIVKLSDLGVSKILQSSLDAAKTITGTPQYMAPELLEGGLYDCKSDVWSLGCVLYELATFSPPFTGSALGAVIGHILHSDPAPISRRYSSPFRALVAKLLQKDPRHRPSLTEILSSDAVQHHLLQLVSVTTSHQPMLLEQFAARHRHVGSSPAEMLESTTLAAFASPLPTCQFYSIDNVAGVPMSELLIPTTTSSIKQQPEADHARKLFFENQAAARRNKERIDQEKSHTAVFLDCRGSEPSFEAAAKPGPPPAPASPPSPQSSPASYEELLQTERRRIQIETKALQARMRAMQTADT